MTTLDLVSGYWQVSVAPSSREKTTFTTQFGLFEFEVMPFGLHNVPATFQRMINHVLCDCQSFIQAYIDDVAIFNHRWEDHIDHLRQVFNQLRLAGLTVKLKKCRFGEEKVPYLGRIIGGGELWPDSEKVQAVTEYSHPDTRRQSIPGFGWLLPMLRPIVCSNCGPFDRSDL